MTEQVSQEHVRPRARGLRLSLPISLGRSAWLVLTVYVALAAYVLWRAAILKPYSDTFAYMARYYELQAGGDLAHYLFAPHNMHRLVWQLGLLALDVKVLGGTGLPQIASGAISLGVMAWLLGRQAAKAAPRPLAVPLAAAGAMLALMAGSVLDAAVPINAQYVQTTAFAVAAIVLAEGRDDSPFGWRGAAALACVVASAFGCAVGLAAWPALALGAFWRRDWRWLAVVLVAGLGFSALYLGGAHPPSDGSGVQAALRQPVSAIALTLNTLALPWSRLSGPAGPLEGGVVLLLATLALLSRPCDASGRAGRCFIVFSLATALMSGLGRSDLGTMAPVRYGIMMTPALVGFVILGAPRLARLWRERPRIVEAGLPIALALLLAQNALMSAAAIQGSDRLRNLIASYDAGDRSPEVTRLIDPAVAARLHADHLFQHELHLGSR